MSEISNDFDLNAGEARLIIDHIHLGSMKQFKVDLVFKGFTLITGYNGVGKSVTNKLVWYCNHVAATHAGHILQEVKAADKMTQLYVDGTVDLIFDNLLDVNMTYITETYTILLIIKDSKLITFNLLIHQPEKFNSSDLSSPIYGSASTRLFITYNNYVNLLRKLEIEYIKTLEDLRKLKDFFRIQDILYLERIRIKSIIFEKEKNSIDLTPLGEYTNDSSLIDRILIIRRSIPYIKNGSEIIKLSSLGNGTQALLMQIVFLPWDNLMLRLS